jgi:hypothetical protein
MDKDKLALGGSVLSAIAASLCCHRPASGRRFRCEQFCGSSAFCQMAPPVPDDYCTFAGGGMVSDLLASKSGQLLDGRVRTKLCGQVE